MAKSEVCADCSFFELSNGKSKIAGNCHKPVKPSYPRSMNATDNACQFFSKKASVSTKAKAKAANGEDKKAE
ncbi:MAG: hypothetical protein WC356_02790 [Candidatus Micrarchaeia archaeon]|jgi:hypothetical protein